MTTVLLLLFALLVGSVGIGMIHEARVEARRDGVAETGSIVAAVLFCGLAVVVTLIACGVLP